MGLTSSKEESRTSTSQLRPKRKEKIIKKNIWNNEDYIETKILENKLAPRTSQEYVGDEECPICFMDSILNSCNCCQNSICTNCFVLIKKKDIINIICPYCEFNSFDVTYNNNPNNFSSPDDIKVSTKVDKVPESCIPKSSVQDRYELERQIMKTSTSPSLNITKARRNTSEGLSPRHSLPNPNHIRYKRFSSAESRRLADLARTSDSGDVNEDEDTLLNIMIDQAIKLSLVPDNNGNTTNKNDISSSSSSSSPTINKLIGTKFEEVFAKNIGNLLVTDNENVFDSNEDDDYSDDDQLKIAIALSLSANNKVDKCKIGDHSEDEIDNSGQFNSPVRAISPQLSQENVQSSIVEKIKSALKTPPGTFSWEGPHDGEICAKNGEICPNDGEKGSIMFEEDDSEGIFKSNNQIQDESKPLSQNPLIFKTDDEL
jgi:hypothetical protein